jgi:hypothetical protein
LSGTSFITTPENGIHPTIILAYDEENTPMTPENGDPLRFVVVSDCSDIITGGFRMGDKPRSCA